jgi:hypothetical protein
VDTERRTYDYKELPSRKELWCVTHVGSNYVQLESPSRAFLRVHLKDLPEYLREPNPGPHLQKEAADCRARALDCTRRIESLCARLGLTPRPALTDGGPPGTEIVPADRGRRVKEYKKELALAHEKELPELFKELRHHNEELATAMCAEALPLRGYIKALDDRLGLVKDRIFHVELYAGLTEEVERITDGAPAGYDELVRVMQRRAYMDEESLIDYHAGGMNFRSVNAFDRRIAKKACRDRLLPFPRCVLAMRVRRDSKDYGPLHPFITLGWDQADRWTYLYLRNGEQLYRLSTEIDFGPTLFPGKNEFKFDGPVYADVGFGSDRVDEVYTEGQYKEMIRVNAEIDAAVAAWHKANPRKSEFEEPYELRRHERFDLHNIRRYSPDDVYYDEIHKHFDDQIKAYNRVLVVLQGLLDRSTVFAPHPPVKLWRPGGPDIIRPVYDEDRALCYGPVPDFRAYQAGCNASTRVGTVCTGQRRYWRIVGTKPDDRAAADAGAPYKKWPYNEAGPALYAPVARYRPRARVCDFVWERDVWDRDALNRVANCRLKVPIGHLLNVEAYRPGDYHRFFDDPRTRRDYLVWAPLLLAAEDYPVVRGHKDKGDTE